MVDVVVEWPIRSIERRKADRNVRPALRGFVVTFPRWSTALALGLFAFVALVVTASATEPLGQKIRISEQAPDGNPAFQAVDPAIAYNTATGGFLHVWAGETDTDDESEIFGRLSGPDGQPQGDSFRISDMGADGDASYGAYSPAVAYNPTADEYLVSWWGDDDAGGLVDEEYEIYVQRLSAGGTEIGGDTRISDMGPDGDPDYNAWFPAVAYNATANEYLVSWHGVDDAAGLAIGETEIFVQRVSAGGTQIGGDTRISDMGPDGDLDYVAGYPAVAYNATANEYLVSWRGVDDTAGFVGEWEIFAQRVSAGGTEIGGDTRISDMGPDGDLDYAADYPAVAYNATANEYLVTWRGDDNTAGLVNDEDEIYVQRVSAGGTEIGGDTRISDMGPDGDLNYTAQEPAVAYNATANEYLVTWWGDDDTAPLVDNEREVFAQRVSAGGTEIGGDTRISDMGPDGDPGYAAYSPAVAYNAAANEYLVSWYGDDDTAPLVNFEFEIWARKVKGGEAPGLTDPVCATPTPIGGSGGGGTLRLTVGQLKINQAIGAAAVRRANAIQTWLEEGIEGRDLCGSSLAPRDLDAGIAITVGSFGPEATVANPRPVNIPAAKDRNAKFTLTATQLAINQRVYAAAIRRANALKARIEGTLTGGDIDDGTLGRDRLRRDLTIISTTGPARAPAKSKTAIKKPGISTAKITPTLTQLRINQRIARGAVIRTNTLRTLLATGLRGENFTDGTITAADLEPPAAP